MFYQPGVEIRLLSRLHLKAYLSDGELIFGSFDLTHNSSACLQYKNGASVNG